MIMICVQQNNFAIFVLVDD